MKQLAVDLVILNERASSYVQDLQIALETLVRTSQSSSPDGVERRRGRVFVLRADLISPEARALLASVARVVLVGQRGSLADQLDRVPEPKEADRTRRKRAVAGRNRGTARRCRRRGRTAGARVLQRAWRLCRRTGGNMSRSSGPGQSTPAPWINVIANPDFGFQVATEGGGYTWSVNSRENQLTPWSNDPVSDRPGEVFYLRDDDTGELWCPTALPIRDDAAHLRRAAWLGLQPLRACRARHRRRSAAVRAARRSDQDLAPDAAQHLRPHAAPVGDRLCGMGAWPIAHRLGAVRDDRDRSRDRRAVRAQSVERRVRIARRLRRSCRAPDGLDRRPARIHRPQRDAGKPRGAWRPQRRSPTPSAPASIPAARCEQRSCCRRMAASRSSASSAKPRATRTRGR